MKGKARFEDTSTPRKIPKMNCSAQRPRDYKAYNKFASNKTYNEARKNNANQQKARRMKLRKKLSALQTNTKFAEVK